jgi:hypothetical protein
MTATTHKVQFYEASCRHCRRTFSIPLLGDQSYGQFIFHGEKGNVYGYPSSFEEPIWEDITERLGRAGLFTSSKSRADIEHLQRVIAASADPISGQGLVLLPVCPGCRSQSLEYGDSKPLDIRHIPSVTFSAYRRLSDESRLERLRSLWEKCA